MDFNDMLINLVRNYPVLYNSKDSGYKDALKKENTWTEISQKLGQSAFAQVASARTNEKDVNPCFPIVPTSYNEYTHTILDGMNFTCCLCGKGHFMDKRCTRDDKNSTVCTLCPFDPDNPKKQSYMDKSPHPYENCFPAIPICTEGMYRIQGNRTYPAVCRCKEGTFLDEETDKCKSHSACKRGYGMVAPGNYENDTDCRWCQEGFESPKESFTQKCTPIDYSISTITTTTNTPSMSTKTTTTPAPYPKPPEETTTTAITEKETVPPVVSTTKLADQPTSSPQSGGSGWVVGIIAGIIIIVLAVVGYIWKKKRSRPGSNHDVRYNPSPVDQNGATPAANSSQIMSAPGPQLEQVRVDRPIDTTDPSAPLLLPAVQNGETSTVDSSTIISASGSPPLDHVRVDQPVDTTDPSVFSYDFSTLIFEDQAHNDSSIDQPQFVDMPGDRPTTGEFNISPSTAPSEMQSSTADSGDDQLHSSSDEAEQQESTPLLSSGGNSPLPDALPSTSGIQSSAKPAKKIVSLENDECNNTDLRADQPLLQAGDGFGDDPSRTPAPSQQAEGPGASHSPPQSVLVGQLPEASQTTRLGPGNPGVAETNEPVAPNTAGPTSNVRAESSGQRNTSNSLRSRELYNKIMLAVKDKISESFTNKEDAMIFFRKFRNNKNSTEADFSDRLYTKGEPVGEVFRKMFADLLTLGREKFNPETIMEHFKSEGILLFVDDIKHILAEFDTPAT